jgi:hypothetical protein
VHVVHQAPLAYQMMSGCAAVAIFTGKIFYETSSVSFMVDIIPGSAF